MADEKNLNENAENAVENAAEEAKEAVTETAEEATEAAENAVEEVVEGVKTEAAEELSDVDKAVAEAMAARDAEDAAKKAKKSKTIKIVAIVAAAVIVVGGVVTSGFVSKATNADGTEGGIQFNTYGGWLPKLVNKYNHMGYVDVTGNTVGDIAVQLGTDVPSFLEQYGLPADMPASTSEMVAFYLMPVKNYAEMYGIDFATVKDLLKIPDKTEDGEDITEDTLWGVAEGEVKVADYIGGEDQLDEFKKQYGFGDEVTGDTKWKEIRTAVDTFAKEQRNASADAANAEATPADDAATADDAASADTAEATPAADAAAAATTAPAAN